MDTFANNLRKRAAELGISNAEAARRSGLSERRYSHYVSGIREPDLATLVRVAQTLQTTPNDLLGVGGARKQTVRSLLLDRLVSAAHGVSDHELEIIAIQTEAVADRTNKRRRQVK